MKMSTIPTLLGPDGMTSLREYAGYHGGGSGFGGQLRAWNPPGESVDAALLPNFTRGNARADDLVRNNGYAANAIQLHQDHIVGSFFRLSHRPSWRYLGIGEEEARAFSREVEAAWKEFAEDDCCCIDVERKRTFTMIELALRVAELEEELDDTDDTAGQDTPLSRENVLTGHENEVGSAQPDTVILDTSELVTVVALVKLHTDALHVTRDEPVAFVLPGTAFRVSAGVAAEMTERGLARMQ